MCLGSNEAFYFAKMGEFCLCLSITVISISEAGHDFEVKIQTVPFPKANKGCFHLFFFPHFCLKSTHSCSKLYF